jgi:perosamine synthetase
MTASPRVARASQIPLAQPNIGPREIELVTEVLRSDVLAMGPYTEAFERGIAELSGRRHAIACSSGTAGLHMAVRALDIGAGDEVITTPFSFVASSNCVLFERAIPRFVDIEEESLGIDPGLVEEAAGERTRALLPVHVYGNPCRVDELAAIARDHGWALIEDSCEALGGSLNGRMLGSFGEASVFAFYPNKQITTGEGGVVLTDDDALAERLRSLRNQGRDADGTWMHHIQLGFNYRMDEMSAALGVAQLERLTELHAGRDAVFGFYADALAARNWVRLPRPAAGAAVDWFVYVVRLDPDIDRDRLIGQLAERGVPSRPYFSPIHLQPFYAEQFGYGPGSFPVTERVSRSALALPFSSRLDESAVREVAAALDDAVAEQGRA